MTRSAALFDYSSRKVALIACPFCREMYEEGEERLCPVCGVALQRFDKLAPRPENLLEEGEAPPEPEYENLPFTYLGRNRGALLAVAAIGFALFFFPWAIYTLAGDRDTYTGAELAGSMKQLWVGCVCWFLMVPAVLSRRSIMKMRGARVALASLSVMPGILAVSVIVNRHSDAWETQEVAWATYATVAASVVALALSFGFGGKVEGASPRKPGEPV